MENFGYPASVANALLCLERLCENHRVIDAPDAR
jgi:hypothetical protein